MDLLALTDDELNTLHDEAVAQKQYAAQATYHNERVRRYRAARTTWKAQQWKHADEYNRRAESATGLHHGDRVEATFTGPFMSVSHFTGRVVYGRDGRLYVRTDHADDTGRRHSPISKAWKRIS